MPVGYQAGNTGTGQSQRRIMGLMAFAVIFSLAGEEIKKAQQLNQGQASTPAPMLSATAKIILGGTLASALLMLAAEFGTNGAQLGEGLAGIATVTAMFVEGKPVWDGVSNVIGGKATKPTGNTGNTQPT